VIGPSLCFARVSVLYQPLEFYLFLGSSVSVGPLSSSRLWTLTTLRSHPSPSVTGMSTMYPPTVQRMFCVPPPRVTGRQGHTSTPRGCARTRRPGRSGASSRKWAQHGNERTASDGTVTSEAAATATAETESGAEAVAACEVVRQGGARRMAPLLFPAKHMLRDEERDIYFTPPVQEPPVTC